MSLRTEAAPGTAPASIGLPLPAGVCGALLSVALG